MKEFPLQVGKKSALRKDFFPRVSRGEVVIVPLKKPKAVPIIY